MAAPDVSVLIATYNHGRFLPEALESVFAQAVPNVEVVVIDDGSQDGTAAVVESFRDRVRYVRQENRGVSAARNRGLAESRAPVVAFLDADDTWAPGAAAALLAHLTGDPGLGIAAPSYVPIDAEGRVSGPAFRKRSPGIRVTTETLLLTDADVSGCVARREAIEQAGGFREENRYAGEYELWLNLSLRWGIVLLPEPLLRRREHEANVSWNVPRVLADKIAAVDRFAATHAPWAESRRRLLRRAQSKNHERWAKWCLRSPDPTHRAAAGEQLARAIALNPFRLKLRLMRATRRSP